jgi:hypothetical protein
MPRRIGHRREVFTLDTFQPFDTTVGEQQGYGQAHTQARKAGLYGLMVLAFPLCH